MYFLRCNISVLQVVLLSAYNVWEVFPSALLTHSTLGTTTIQGALICQMLRGEGSKSFVGRSSCTYN